MWTQKKQNKYGNVRQTYQGYNYQSKKEAQKAFELDLMVKAGEIDNWTRQENIKLMVNGVQVGTYKIDFVVFHNGKILEEGVKEYIEIKGFETSTWRLKWKIFEAMMKDEDKVKLTVER